MIGLGKFSVLSVVVLSACASGPDKSRDRGLDSKDLSEIVWGIYVDPIGCDTWLADDGLEGYQVRRIDKYGKPICSGVAPPNTAIGPYKEGSNVPDLI